MTTEREILLALSEVMDPELGRSIVDLEMVRHLRLEDGCVSFALALTMLACPLKEQIQADARAAVLALDGISSVAIDLIDMTPEEKSRAFRQGGQPQGLTEQMNHVNHVIAVMSGKGGVGKSLVTGLLAVCLRRQGHLVGILDADITGPSIPKMFLSNGARPTGGPIGINPVLTRTGIEVMSINLLLEDEDQAVIWRGPIISGTIRQFWSEVLWGDLDYLIVDLPPGTSDASLTVLQSLPMSGAVLVTSPQDLAGMVVRKAAQMIRQVGVPLLGLVENMSYFVCPDTGKHHEIFGSSRSELMAARLGVPFLGSVPIDPDIARLCDTGRIETYPGDAFRPIAERIAALATVAAQPVMPGT